MLWYKIHLCIICDVLLFITSYTVITAEYLQVLRTTSGKFLGVHICKNLNPKYKNEV